MDLTEILQDNMTKLKNEAALRQAGLSAEESMRIVYGEKETSEIFSLIHELPIKDKENEH